MSRTDDSAAIDAVLDDDFLIPVSFLEAQFPTGTIYLHTDLGTITTLGEDWLGVGDLGSISDISQDDTGKPTKWEAVLSAIDPVIIDQAINQNFFEREAILYLSFRNVITGALVDDPLEIERGRMDQMDAVTGGQASVVKLTVESEMIDTERSLDRYYSDNQQQEEYPGDLAFQFLATLRDAKIIWQPGKQSLVLGSASQVTLPAIGPGGSYLNF